MDLGTIAIGGLSVVALGGNLLSKNNVNVEEIANQVIDVISESESEQNI